MKILLYPLLPAIILGLVNYLYWRKKGYRSTTQLLLGIMVFYALFYVIFKKFVFGG